MTIDVLRISSDAASVAASYAMFGESAPRSTVSISASHFQVIAAACSVSVDPSVLQLSAPISSAVALYCTVIRLKNLTQVTRDA